MENIEWKDIPGYEGRYQIAICGNEAFCKSLNYLGVKGRVQLLANNPGQRGRIYWNLGGTYRQAGFFVALAFPEICGEWFEGAEIDHIDTNPLNNNPNNLRFVTHLDNMSNTLTLKHMSNSRTGKKHSEATLKKLRKPHKNGKRICQYSIQGEFIRDYHSFYQLEKETGFSRGNIWLACQSKKGAPYGYIWRYGTLKH